MDEDHPREGIAQHIKKSLRIRLRAYFIIACGLILFGGYEIFLGHVALAVSIITLLIGILLGIFFSRIFHISWDHGSEQVSTKVDTVGSILLAFYVLFEVFRTEVIGYFSHEAVFPLSLVLIAGILIGRVIGMRGSILMVISENL